MKNGEMQKHALGRRSMATKLRYMLDSNVIIDIMNGRSDKAFFEMTRHDKGEICVSAIVYSELLFGIEGSDRRERSLELLDRFLDGIEIIDFDAEAAKEYGRIRQFLRKSGTPIGERDTLIAAHANSRDLTLVTHNVREFVRVPGLEIADWT